MNTKKALFAFASAVAAFSASGVYADLPAPTTPNPGLKYYYPVPKSENPVENEYDIVVYGARPRASARLCRRGAWAKPPRSTFSEDTSAA